MQWLGNDEYSQPFHTSSLVGVTEALDEWFDGLSRSATLVSAHHVRFERFHMFINVHQ